MILPCPSRSIRSIGWMISERTRTTSPALMLVGSRSRTLPMSDMPLPSTPADGDLDLALDLEHGAVALFDDRANVAGLAQPDVGAHRRLSGLGRQVDPRDDRNPILVGDDVDLLHVVRRRHRRGDLHGDGHHGAGP